MEIDSYQQCPCHSGKKIKFCCGKDIVSDLNQIVAKFNSNQSLSALDHIERVIGKQGMRDCLLNLRTHILFTTGEIDKAKDSNEQFVARNPNHPIGRQHESMIALSQGQLSLAVEKLQDAMDLVQGDEIPLSMSNVFKVVGESLLKVGQVIASRAHLQIAASIRGADSAQEIHPSLAATYALPALPLILKSEFFLDKVNEDNQWASKFETVRRTFDRGQFRLALKMLEKMDAHWPDQYPIVRGIAILQSTLARDGEIETAWARVAKVPDVPRWKAVEAQAISLMFNQSDPSGEFDVAVITIPIDDLEKIFQLAESSPRCLASAPPEKDLASDGPPPRYAYQILDRDPFDDATDIQAKDVPLVIGELLLYGKQTDRAARLALATVKDELFDSKKELLQTIFGSELNGDPEEAVISQIPKAVHALTWSWHIPREASPTRHRELIAEYQGFLLSEKWSNLEFSCLNGLTPNQAKDDDSLSICVEALLLNLSQSTILQLSGEQQIENLKTQLGIPIENSLDAAEYADEEWSPMRATHFDPKTFSDEQLIQLYAEAVSIANIKLLKRILPEILQRDTLDQIRSDTCYSLLAQLADDDEQAIEMMRKARQEAKNVGASLGMLLVQEFEIRLTRGMIDKLPELLNTLQNKYIDDPNVEQQLIRVLSKYGLISPDGRTVSLPTMQKPESESAESELWTPDSGEPAISSGDSSSASKIWVPGSD